MKKAIKLFAAITMIIGASYVNAKGTKLKASVVGEARFRVEVTGIQGSSVYYIRDNEGQVLYRNNSEANELRFVFDFSNLEVGTYELVVKDAFKKQVQPIHYTKNGIDIEKEELKKTFFPKMEQDGDKVLVRLLSNETNDLSVSIQSEDGNILLSETLEAQTGLIGKKYLFAPGDYTVTMISEDFATTKNLTIKK